MGYLTFETLSIERVRAAAGWTIYQRGEAYYEWGRVQIKEVGEDKASFFVRGTRTYSVGIEITDKFLYLKCNCDYATGKNVCKHQVAAYLALRDYLYEHRKVHWSENLDQLLQSNRSSGRPAAPRKYLLLFSLQAYTTPAYTSWKIAPYTLAANQLPKDYQPEEAQKSLQLGELMEEYPHLSAQIRNPYQLLDPKGCINTSPEAVVLANLMIERTRGYNYYGTSPPLQDYLPLIESTHSPIFFGSSNSAVQKYLEIVREPGEMHISIVKDEKHLHLEALIVAGDQRIPLADQEGNSQVRVIAANPLWLLLGNRLVHLDASVNSDLFDSWLEVQKLDVPVEEEEDFLTRYYLRLAQNLVVEGDLVKWEEIREKPVPRLYLSDTKGTLQAILRFGYGSAEVDFDSSLPGFSVERKPGEWTLLRIHRDQEAEESFYKALSATTYRLKRAPKPAPAGVFTLRAQAHPIDFLMQSIPALTKDGYEIFGEEKLKTIQVNRAKPSLSFQVSSGIDWFDVKAVVNFGELEVSLKDIRRALRKKERYIKLVDGSVGELPEEWLDRYKHLFALGEETENGLRVSNKHLTLLDQIMSKDAAVQVDAEFERRRERLRSFEGIKPVPLPERFQGELRPYQKAGYDWLHFLNEFQFGGCLADDMGLGKTIQVLVFLQSLREGSGGKPIPEKADLIIVPRSLLANWQREAGRFTPNLRILEYFDSRRPQNTQAFDQYDVVITTYGVMLRDIKGLCAYPFNYIILDESQAIKNPNAQTSRAARQLRSSHRLVLTGTPVENSSTELWSQFAFLNPGLLGKLEYFQTEFVTPIEKKGSEETAAFLRKLVFPFILRRTKAQVAPELPPRTERVMYCDLETAQLKLYNRTRDYYRGMLLGMFEKEGLDNARMKILEGLLRLRQIAIHPKLMDESFRGPSGKFDLLFETIDTLHSEGHKALIFSQFVQVLKLIQHHLNERKIPYEYLDGSTRDRQARVDSFQTDDTKRFFLISLKAGGQGLNLTAADYVIHVDPWWNPAVEMQATDRTHRIGQEKPVFVYKLIARNTVEEKLMQLQERKKQLVEQIITVESSFFKEITEDDVRVLFS